MPEFFDGCGQSRKGLRAETSREPSGRADQPALPHADTKRRIQKHLKPSFGDKRMSSITTSDIRAYVAKRQTDGRLVKPDDTRTNSAEQDPNRR